MTDVVATPEWAIVRRGDAKTLCVEETAGAWTARVVPATRGVPFTNFGTREIAVPAGDHPTARVVRAHELAHATLSPTTLTPALVEAMGVSFTTVALAEEMRINYLLSLDQKRLGVDMKAMRDGTELRDAKMAVAGNDFVSAMSVVCATMFTGAERGVATEVQRGFPAVRQLRKALKKHLATAGSRGQWARSTTPEGFAFTVTDVEGNVETQMTQLPTGFIEHTLPLAQILERYLPRKGEGHGEYLERVEQQAQQEDTGRGGRGARWGKLRFGTVPMNESGLGFLTRTKRASGVGRSPRRLHRLLTDPERRVFDRVSRKSGGVVLVDGSGSMSLTSDDLREIVQAAPGCLVAVYSYDGADEPNIWIVAQNGRYARAEDFPCIGSDNIVDLPAIEWAVSRRERKTDPVIWVSDGHVTTIGAGMTPKAGIEVIDAVRRGRVTQVPYASKAVEVLRECARGSKAPTQLVGWLKDLERATDRRTEIEPD